MEAGVEGIARGDARPRDGGLQIEADVFQLGRSDHCLS
jgi:hypothetical protein